MAPRNVFASVIILLVRISKAAVLQHPLQAANSDLSYRDAFALEKLISSVGDQLFNATPIGQQCYKPFFGLSGPCNFTSGLRTNDSWTTDQPGGYFYGNLAACQATGETCILPLNDTAIPADATCYQGSVPSRMIELNSTETLQRDIEAAFNFTRSSNKPLVIKNTGHDWKGRSSGPDSLALWTHRLQHPKVPILYEANFTAIGCKDTEPEKVFHYGPGQQWGKAYEFANNMSLAIVGGTCPSVGVAGWLQGGGHSPMTPVYGMGVDNVRQLEIITPNAGKVIANECQNRDLFFAMRGGGGGTFGIITNITYKAIEIHKVQDLRYSLNVPEANMTQYFEVLTKNMVDWSKKGWGGYIKTGAKNQTVQLINPRRNNEEAKADMHELIAFAQQFSIKGEITIQTKDSWYHYVKEVMMPHDVHIGLWGWNTAARLMPTIAFENDTRPTLNQAFKKMYDDNLYFWMMLVAPTNFSHTTTSSLHPSWKTAVVSVRVGKQWDQFFDEKTPEAYAKHFQEAHDSFAPIRELAPNMGISISEADIWEENPEELFWGKENHERLKEIKKKVDPENLLTNYQAVGWDPSDARYRCYPKRTAPKLEL